MHEQAASVRSTRTSSAPLVCGVALALVVGGCTSTSPARSSPTPSAGLPIVTGTVALPPPNVNGPTITIEGMTTWRGAVPGCVVVQTDRGQVFQVTGQATNVHLGAVRAGTARVVQRMRLTGYLAKVGGMVCPGIRAFVARQLTPVD